MKKALTLSALLVLLIVAGCKKDTTPAITGSDEANVLKDFANVLVNSNYRDIQAKALVLNQAITTFNASPTDANLALAQTAWRASRAPWESCEGYLFGPVESDNYDPNMDTWPLDQNQTDHLLASTNPLTVSDIDGLDQSIKGFHAIEYIIFGPGSKQTAAQIDSRQMTFIASLSLSLYNTTTALRNSWDTTQPNNYSSLLINAGPKNDTAFTSRQAAFHTIVEKMAGICDEVGTGKMQDPLGPTGNTPDSTQDESSYSHNSTTDFTNNITSIRNAYFCTYGGATGHSVHDLVSATNKSLDVQISSAITDAIGSFSTIPDYEIAIYTQRTQITAVQAKIATLHDLLNTNLQLWVTQNIHD